MATGFSIRGVAQALRQRNWARKEPGLVSWELLLVLLSFVLALFIIRQLPAPNSRTTRASDTDVAHSALGFVGAIGGILRILFAPLDLLLTAFWDFANGALRFLLEIPVIGDLLRVFFRILALPFELLGVGSQWEQTKTPCEDLDAELSALKESVRNLEEVHRARQ
jgi:hypothetical protein